jgi:hypothetical protein
MKKKLRMYLHHGQYEPITYHKEAGVFGFVKRIITVPGEAMINVCYSVGMLLLFIFTLPFQIAKLTPIIQKRFKTQQFQKTVAGFAVLALLAGSTILD